MLRRESPLPEIEVVWMVVEKLQFVRGVNETFSVVSACSTRGVTMRQFIGIFGRMFKVLMITALLVPALATSAIAYWTITDLGTLGAAGSEAYGINDIGQVTGESYIFGPVDDHAFIYTLATGMQDLETLGGNFSAGSGINNSGQVTGGSTTAGGVTHAFLYSATTGMIDLGTLGGSGFTMGNSINDSGQVTGGSTTAGGNTHAFLYSVTTGIIDLGTLGGSDSAGICINNLGQVAGWSNTAGGAEDAFLYSNGQMTDLNTLIDPSLGWTLYTANGINDSGEITGIGFIDGQAQRHAFLLSPFSGSLTVSISPAAAVIAGAMWNVDGGSLQTSGTTISGLPVGQHTVSFNNVIDWNTPANQTANIVNGQTTSLTGVYGQTQLGSLTVQISPTAAVSAGAMWNVDGGAWQASGGVVFSLSVGIHTVAFNNVQGWTTPSSQTFNISSGITTSLTGVYVQQTGSLTVTISPAAAVSAGAMWNVDGGAWQASGTTISGLTLGQHTVAFNNIAGWNTPANQTANITNGQPTSLTGAYVQQTGSLTVAISPAAAVSAGAQWNVDGGPWQTSGATVSAAVGSHTVNFNTIAGWSAPASQTVNITNGQTTSATGLYVQQYGALTVMIGPAAAVSAGAQWNVDGGSWQLNGATVSAAVGSHTINFFTITGWTSPASQTVNIVNLQTTSASGAYIQQFGSLTVTITPAAAVSAGAQWNVDGGSWQTSGTTISGLTVGQHTVAFNNITGWNTPASQTVTIANGQTTAAGGAYEQLTDSLKVTIGPLAAVHAGAQWQVDGGVWQNSGVTANGLTYGRHVVGFKEIQGWKAPADQTVTIAKGKTTTSIGTYLQLPVVLKYKISNGAASSITRQVTLNNQTSGNPTKYMASESQDFIGAVWQTYSDDPKFTLSAGGGIKTVYFKVENRAGESGVASDAIQLIVPPTVTSFEINNGATATSSRTVTLDNTATESPTYYMASQSSTFIGAIWKPYAAAPAFTLSSGNGTKTVYFKVKNAAGASKVVSETITLD